ncbi:DUF748 domain-containing protein [uncultured Paraglaciecola sp.]|uniref:DUF748 domain-containing protein n=1 Tax=uncultured Paraglaciecola sp. TaxID=1765024 RepID=UPI0030D73B5E|tara:strand:- start:40097 stop:41212 length:1116 start_codon:yes stop_codon:yes gene_type:complete
MNWYQSFKLSRIIMICLLVTLILARVAAPSILTWYANRTIENTQGISGTVADVDLALISGSYSIFQGNIRQTGDGQELPLFVWERMDISILWSALLQGELVAEIVLIAPQISLYDRPQNKVFESAAVTDQKTWLGLARTLSPFAIDKLTVKNATFSMDAESKLKRSRFTVQNIQLTVTHISNSKEKDNIAQVVLQGDIQDHAKLLINGTFDPNTQEPTFDINLEMAKLPVSYIDSLMKFYAPFDFEAGQIDLACELKSIEGKVTGYVQAGIYELDVFSWHEDVVEDGDNPIRLMLDIVGGALATLFENDNKKLLATRVPISGVLDNPNVSTFDALLGILRNAFVEAYSLKVENSISSLKAPSKSETQNKPS